MSHTRTVWFSRLTWACVAAAGALLAPQLLLAVLSVVNSEWSGVRLAPTVALLHGVPLWVPFGEGPTLDAIYGPVAPLAWLPVGLAATPTGALAIGAVESFVLLMVPMSVIAAAEARRHAALIAASVLMGLALLLSSPALPVIGVHADVPALACATAAIACAWTNGRRQDARWRVAGAAFVVASVGAKQVMAPLLVAYPLWIGLTSGWKAARAAFLAVAGAMAAMLAMIVLTVDEAALFDAAIVGPSRHPFQGDAPLRALASAAVELAQRGAPLVVLLGIVGAAVWRRSHSLRDAVRKHRWLFPLAVGIACLPTTLLSAAKLGGAVNAFSFTLWFVWLALIAALATTGRRGRSVRQTLTLGAAVVACALAIRLAPDLAKLGPLVSEPALPTVAFQAARQAPGSIYFPYNPVVALMADGRAYHLDAGLEYRRVEGRDVNERYVRAFLPAEMKRVAASRQEMPGVLRFLPRFRRQIIDASLPGWTVMTESDLLGDGEAPGDATSLGPLNAVIPTSVLAPDSAAATLLAAQVRVPDRSRRPFVRLDATVSERQAHDRLEIEVLLYDKDGRYVQSLVGESRGGERDVELEWRVFADLLRSAMLALVVMRGGRPKDGEAWRLSGEEVGALVAASRLQVRLPDQIVSDRSRVTVRSGESRRDAW